MLRSWGPSRLDVFLYRYAADEAFLALIAANAFMAGVIPRDRAERGRTLRELGDLRALYSDLMKRLHEEAFCEGVCQLDEVKYAVEKAKKLVEELGGYV